MAELIMYSESFDNTNEVQDALPGDSEELFNISDFHVSLEREVVPAGTFSELSGPCKLKPDIQELGLTCVGNEGIETPSSRGTETFIELSNSTLSPQRQVRLVVNSPIISPLPSDSDFQEVDRNNEEITHSTISDGVSQPDPFGPKPIVVVERLTEKAIEELTAGIWRCRSCGKAEKSYLILDLHIDTGCEQLSPIECDVCPAVVREYNNFVAHFMEHKMGEKRRCPICLQESIADLKQHLILEGHLSLNVSELDLQGNSSLAVSKNPPTNSCSNSFESERKAKGLNNQNECLKTLLQGKKHRKFDRRQKIQLGKKRYKCNICQKCFFYPSGLKNHQRMHTGEKPFKCGICLKSYSQVGHFNIHQRVHTGEKPFKCHVCLKRFVDSTGLTVHRRIHTGEKPFNCDICEKRYLHASDLKKHQRVHTGEKPFICDICQKKFSVSSHLNTHRRVHTGEKPFQCDVCHKRFFISSHLNTHRRVHTGEKPFQCDVCKKTFSRAEHLNTHQRVHTGEKPFKCEACNTTFSQAVNLNTHQRVHTGEKPFKCDTCKKCFSISTHLIQHKRLHTGEKPYKCNICERVFSSKLSLKYHLKTHS